jgi:hypothetical protein
MIVRSSRVGYGSSPNLLLHLLYRITAFILAAVAIVLTIDSDKIGLCADKPTSVPNIVFILADDKYHESWPRAHQPLGIWGKCVFFRPFADR